VSGVCLHRARRGPVSLLLVALLLVGALATTPAAAEPVAPAPPPLGEDPLPGWPTAAGLEASSWVLVEAATGQVLAERGADRRRPVASTIKVLTALTVLDRAEPDDLVTAGEEAAGVEGASVGIVPGDTWTIEQLLDAIIIRSGNDAAEVLAAHVAGDADAFAELMADDARALGLDDAVVVDPSGLTDENLFTAAELAVLARAALDDPRLRPILARTDVELPGQDPIETRNELLLTYDGATGVKTGFTIAAGNSLIGSAERDGRELITVVLDAGEDPATRFLEAAELLDLGFDAFEPTTVEGDVSYAVAGGEVRFDLDATPVTVPTGSEPEPALVPLARPPGGEVPVAVEVDGRPLGEVTMTPVDGGAPRDADGGAAIGRAVADGVYAALRVASAQGELG
jgi:serine-type D-Ala-D-Ala carboxypeptidase (penicillin-binding protein 5/6)